VRLLDEEGRSVIRVACIVVLLALGLVTALPDRALGSAGAQETTPELACPATTADEQAAIARRWFEDILNEANLAALDEIATGDFTYHSGALGEMTADHVGPAVLQPLLVSFPDVHYTIDQVLTGDDVVVLIWHAEGTQIGTHQGYAPTGKRATWTGINVFRFSCDRIAEQWAQSDGLGRLRQLGLVGTPVP
jgi:predicted ester cyclase